MSASAGRVLIIPRGDYNSATTYNMLDMVFYGGKSYICKQTSTGNDPTNTVYWQIMLDGASEFSALSDVELNNLQNCDGIYYDASAQKWKNTTPTSIAITSPPATTEYTVGDILDLTGIVVTAYYVGGSTRNITTECTFSPANGSTLSSSDTAVTVTWRTFTTTQAIEISSIYGVEWDGTSTSTWTRTDAAASFTDPVPYYAGMTGTPSSPFDNISPWKDMQVVGDDDVGTLVSIPKFHYKITQDGAKIKIQISSSPFEGSQVSPAHLKRTSEESDRDVVYVGRYLNSNTYKSETGKTPFSGPASYKRTCRTNIHNLASDVWQYDFSMVLTIWMLYLVEFASWQSSSLVGKESGSGDTGATDSMPYHTGTMQNSPSTSGHGVQYRYIEELWGRSYFYDGCYYNSTGFFIIRNPDSFADTSGGTYMGKPNVNTNNASYPTAFNVTTNAGITMFYPTASGGSGGAVPDRWYYSADNSYPTIYNTGGLFGLWQAVQNSTNCCRLMKLPNS